MRMCLSVKSSAYNWPSIFIMFFNKQIGSMTSCRSRVAVLVTKKVFFCDELCNDKSLQGINLFLSRFPNFHLLWLLPEPGKLYQCKYNQVRFLLLDKLILKKFKMFVGISSWNHNSTIIPYHLQSGIYME